MIDELFSFQEEALTDLKSKVKKAHLLMEDYNNDAQVISFSAPTGSGKTIVMTELFEDIFFGSADFEGQPDAVIIWLSDMPELNEQTRLKIESKSNKIRVRQLITIDSNYDSEYFEDGNIYFLNSQKLGSDKLLTQRSDSRQYTIWETLTNTAQRKPKSFYVVIDEAHRGMNSNNRTEKTAQSTMQKFLLGSEKDGLCQMPLVIGVTATPERFQNLLAHTSSTVHKVIVQPEAVRDSGLLKDRVIIHYPHNSINADMTLLKSAVDNWVKKTEHWLQYCDNEGEKIVKPILVIQVEDGNDKLYTKTDLQACLAILEEGLGRELIEGEVVHTFDDKSKKPVELNGFNIPRVEASRIEYMEEVKVVFFKLNLSTGWDCPRAEVMMSFRSAQDYTYIAQLLGRMVRTPLARRIQSDAELNDVSLFLPYYNEETVNSVIEALNKSEDIVPGEKGSASNLVTLKRNPIFDKIFSSMDKLITYKIDAARKQAPLKRLLALSRALTQDGISITALNQTQEYILNKMDNEVNRLKDIGVFDEMANTITGFDIKFREFDFDKRAFINDSESQTVVAEFDIENTFNRAGKFIGEGLSIEYWKRHMDRGHREVKVEFIVLTNDVDAMQNLNKFAESEFNQLYEANQRAIQSLNEARTHRYDKILCSSGKPVSNPWKIPEFPDFSIPDDAVPYQKHLLVDENGRFETKLQQWENGVLLEELKHGAVAWLRNLDRKQWSLQIPYEKAGVYTPMYPDLIIVREDEHGYIFDILEPHDPSRSDNCEKAKGLAKFAEENWKVFGRIQLIRKIRGADGKERYYRLDMSKASTRNRVRAIADNHALDALFETEAILN
ncbi:DEAD/DEAH box helicase family protein [Priestia megaterium]|uniref:DEAD/DEAH box helicase n=1 Tax=Priestia megaterium TaxID=1404 RepID=UPI003009B721